MKGLISRLAVMFWVGYMGLVLGSVLGRTGNDLLGLAIFIVGFIFGSLFVLLLGWGLVTLVDVIFEEESELFFDLFRVTLAYWFGYFVGLFFRVV
jgi:hypothetical protein